MSRPFLILGAAVDILFALFLLLVFGWIMDSWHDPKGAWVGVTVTTIWLIAFALSAGAPIVGYRLKRRGAPPAHTALAIWLPVIVIAGGTIVGFLVFPP